MPCWPALWTRRCSQPAWKTIIERREGERGCHLQHGALNDALDVEVIQREMLCGSQLTNLVVAREHVVSQMTEKKEEPRCGGGGRDGRCCVGHGVRG